MPDADKVDILIVDDLPDKRLVLESILADLNENVIAAHSGAEALRLVLERPFAVVLLDVNMPGMDGFETAALIRKRRKSAHTPIIFLTAFADEMHTSLGYSLGAVDYILTPVVPDVLRTKVQVFVDLFRMTEQAKRQADERVALAKEQAARATAEEATRRSTFLAGASKVLAASLDREALVRSLMHLVVPHLGDLCVVDLVDANGETFPREFAWTDEAKGRCARSASREEQLHPSLAESFQRVLTTGESESLELLGEEAVTGRAGSAHGEEAAVGSSPSFPLKSAVVLPLMARSNVLGALGLAHGPSGRKFSAADVALVEDLAGRAAIALDNARLYREIQESDRRKNEFLAMLAHELRNPLAPIRNAVQILNLAGPQETTAQQACDAIDRQVLHLVRLVDDLLDISRITRGSIQLKPEPIEVAAVVARAVEVSRPLLDERRHQLSITLPSDPLWVNADPVRLAQVLANLLNNAAKYTDEGGRVWITAAREGGKQSFVSAIQASASRDMVATIFELFTQVKRSSDRSQGGLGIGLTLVKRLIEQHGGTVQASSAGPNKGSEFVVRLPALANAPTRGSPQSVNGKTKARCSRRVLVVDDKVDAAQTLGKLLRLQGHEVRLAHEGPSALQEAASFQPEVVLLDIGLPGMDGYEVARRLRSEIGLKNTVLAALTGYGQDEDRRLSRLAGINVHLVKPVDLGILYEILARPEELRSAKALDSTALDLSPQEIDKQFGSTFPPHLRFRTGQFRHDVNQYGTSFAQSLVQQRRRQEFPRAM